MTTKKVNETTERTLSDAIALAEKASDRLIRLRSSAHIRAVKPTAATKEEK